MAEPDRQLSSTPSLSETLALTSVSINTFASVDTSIDRYYTRYIRT